jgi:hypothetical protein
MVVIPPVRHISSGRNAQLITEILSPVHLQHYLEE